MRPKASSLYFKSILTCRWRPIKINTQIIPTLCSATPCMISRKIKKQKWIWNLFDACASYSFIRWNPINESTRSSTNNSYSHPFIHSSIISTWCDHHQQPQQQQQQQPRNVLDKRKHKRDDNKSKLKTSSRVVIIHRSVPITA